MKVELLCIGKTTYKPFVESIERYNSRLQHYIPFRINEIPDIRNTRNMSVEQQKISEGKNILSSISPSDYLVLLDEKGSEFTSREFANFMKKKMVNVSSRLVFVIGGPYGFSEDIYKRADFKLSLSKMTFPHELVRIIFVEQIYRALTILKGEPYHHD